MVKKLGELSINALFKVWRSIILTYLSNILGNRPPMSQDDLNMVIDQTFTQQELDDFKETHQNVLNKFADY